MDTKREVNMPLYSFSCPACGKRFEEILTVARKDEAVCPDCGRKAERVWNGKCNFGAKRSGGCSGHCAGCSGCGK